MQRNRRRAHSGIGCSDSVKEAAMSGKLKTVKKAEVDSKKLKTARPSELTMSIIRLLGIEEKAS